MLYKLFPLFILVTSLGIMVVKRMWLRKYEKPAKEQELKKLLPQSLKELGSWKEKTANND